jgi:hypothetical protein
MPHPVPHRVRLACGAAKAAVVVTMVAMALGLGPGVAGDAVADHGGPAADGPLGRHQCSPTGFDDGSQPRSALIRTPAGKLRFVDFDTGWRVYRRHGAATLVALCLDDPPAR